MLTVRFWFSSIRFRWDQMMNLLRILNLKMASWTFHGMATPGVSLMKSKKHLNTWSLSKLHLVRFRICHSATISDQENALIIIFMLHHWALHDFQCKMNLEVKGQWDGSRLSSSVEPFLNSQKNEYSEKMNIETIKIIKSNPKKVLVLPFGNWLWSLGGNTGN